MLYHGFGKRKINNGGQGVDESSARSSGFQAEGPVGMQTDGPTSQCPSDDPIY